MDGKQTNPAAPSWRSRALLILVMAVAMPMHAMAWSKMYSVSYMLGDNDTPASAMKIALGRIRLKAAAEAGHLVYGERDIENGKYRSAVTEIGVDIVRVSAIRSSMSIKSGRAVLNVHAIASIDQRSLRRDIDAVLSNERMTARLTTQLKAYRNDLEALSSSRLNARDAENDMSSRRDSDLQNMDALLNAGRNRFPRGTLLNQVEATETQHQRLITEQERVTNAHMLAIDREVIGPVMERTKLTVLRHAVRSLPGGHRYVVDADVQWLIPVEKISAVAAVLKFTHLRRIEPDEPASPFVDNMLAITFLESSVRGRVENLSEDIQEDVEGGKLSLNRINGDMDVYVAAIRPGSVMFGQKMDYEDKVRSRFNPSPDVSYGGPGGSVYLGYECMDYLSNRCEDPMVEQPGFADIISLLSRIAIYVDVYAMSGPDKVLAKRSVLMGWLTWESDTEPLFEMKSGYASVHFHFSKSELASITGFKAGLRRVELKKPVPRIVPIQ